jgi:Uma2 family endonuclease
MDRLVTAEQFWAMPEPLDKRIELVNGHVVELLALTAQQGLIVGNVYRALREHVERDDLGLVFTSGLGYVLSREPDSVRMTHASFISWDSLPKQGVPDWFVEGPPLIAVQVVGPYDQASELQERVSHFLAAGTRQVWILWPQSREVEIRIIDGVERRLRPNDQFDGWAVLPGFRVPVASLFEIPQRPSDL